MRTTEPASFRRVLQHLIPPRGWIVPTTDSLRVAISRVQGAFQTSAREDAWTFITIVLFMLPLGILAGKSWSDFQRTSLDRDLWLAITGVVLMMGVALLLMPRFGVRYEFREGHIEKLTASGKVVWRECLTTVPRIVLCRDKLNTFITLRWPERRRSFLVPDSLANAIDEAQASLHETES